MRNSAIIVFIFRIVGPKDNASSNKARQTIIKRRRSCRLCKRRIHQRKSKIPLLCIIVKEGKVSHLLFRRKPPGSKQWLQEFTSNLLCKLSIYLFIYLIVEMGWGSTNTYSVETLFKKFDNVIS